MPYGSDLMLWEGIIFFLFGTTLRDLSHTKEYKGFFSIFCPYAIDFNE